MRKRATLFLALTLLASAAAQSVNQPQKTRLKILSLTRDNDGQQLAATVGEPIEITLQAIGPREWETPRVSSTAIRFENTMLKMPANPGGPTQVFIFTAAIAGKATIQIHYSDSDDTFTVTIEVQPPSGQSQSLAVPDQVNAAEWKDAWTNLVNDTRETFTPSLPVLTRVEVELVVANPGPSHDNLTMTLYDGDGQLLAAVSRTVPEQDCDRVSFVLPEGGIGVTPGRRYSIRLRGSMLFGWKYVVGGYAKGEALFNGAPLLPGGHSTFLFRTYGAS